MDQNHGFRWFPVDVSLKTIPLPPGHTGAVKQVVATLPEPLGRILGMDLDIWDYLG